MMASFITTFFMGAFDEPSHHSFSYFSYFYYISPWEVAQDLVTAAFRVIRDGELSGVFEDTVTYTTAKGSVNVPVPRPPPGIIKRFVRRFILGLPLVGAGSLVQMFLSVQALGPIQWIARYRGSRNRRNSNSRDIAAVIVITLLLVGAFRSDGIFIFISSIMLPNWRFSQSFIQGLSFHRKTNKKSSSSCRRIDIRSKLKDLLIMYLWVHSRCICRSRNNSYLSEVA